MQNIFGKKSKKGKWNIIIRTVGNRPDYLLQALYSVALQTYENKSVFLVVQNKDAKVFEEQVNISKNFSSFFEINVLKADSKKKMGHPINVGLDNCDGEFVSFLDDDDIYYPNFGDALTGPLLNEDFNFTYGVAMAVQQEKVQDFYKTTKKHLLYYEEFNPLKLISSNYIQTCTYIFKREVFEDIRVDETMDILEDWDFLLQFLFSEKLKPKFVPETISEHRRRNDHTNSFYESEVKSERYRSAVKTIGEKYKDKELKIKFPEIFKIYPDYCQILGIDINEAEIQKLKNEITHLEEKAKELHKDLTYYFNEYNLLKQKSGNTLWNLKKAARNIVGKR